MAIHAIGLMAVTMPMRFADASTVRRTSWSSGIISSRSASARRSPGFMHRPLVLGKAGERPLHDRRGRRARASTGEPRGARPGSVARRAPASRRCAACRGGRAGTGRRSRAGSARDAEKPTRQSSPKASQPTQSCARRARRRRRRANHMVVASTTSPSDARQQQRAPADAVADVGDRRAHGGARGACR